MSDDAPPPPGPEPQRPPAGWYADPQAPGTAQLRYWDGTTWTEHTHWPQTPAPTQPHAYGSAGAYGTAGAGQAGASVDPWLWQSIVATLLCCMPAGIVGIVFAAKSQSELNVGNLAGARQQAGTARTWTLVAVGLGVAAWPLFFFVGAFSGM